MKNIALLLPTERDGDPVLNYEASEIDWNALRIDCWHYPAGDVDSSIGPQTAIVDHPLATSWDFYLVPATWGIVSNRLRDCLQQGTPMCFDFWPIDLNGTRYFVIRRIGVVDCLDHDRCGRYEDGSHIDYDPFAFDESKLPESAVFGIAESTFIFATEDFANLIVKCDFTGLDVYNARGHRRMLENMEWVSDSTG